MLKVLILGDGLLGRQLIKQLSTNSSLAISVASRTQKSSDGLIYPFYKFNAVCDVPFFAKNYDYIINTIVEKREIQELALLINALFPINLAKNCPSARIIHISTNGVFKPKALSDAPYGEFSERNATSIYGLTKGLGEVMASNMLNLRCSFIGREGGLVKWFMDQPEDATVQGYCTHFWDGITNVSLAKIIEGIVTGGGFDNYVKLSNIFHICPANEMSKGHLLGLIKAASGKTTNISRKIVDVKDLTISTVFKTSNEAFWRGAGYENVPNIEQLVEEMFKV